MNFTTKKYLSIVPIVMGLVISACGNKKDDNSSPPPPPPVAQTTVNGMTFPKDVEFVDQLAKCNTKYHVNNFQEYCSSLNDEAKNNNCARTQRQQAYYLNCQMNAQNPQGIPQQNGRGVVVPPQNTIGIQQQVTMMGFSCQIHGTDNSDGFALNKSYNYSRMITWSGKKRESFNLTMLGASKYGRPKLVLNPADRKSKTATMELRNSFSDRGAEFVATGSVVNGISMVINNIELEKDVSIDCLPIQKINSVFDNLQYRELTCIGNLKDSGIKSKIDKKIIWDAKSVQDFNLDDDSRAILRLSPAANNNQAIADVFVETDSGSKLQVRSFANSSFQINDSTIESKIQISCTVK